jgi:hypothetical protein
MISVVALVQLSMPWHDRQRVYLTARVPQCRCVEVATIIQYSKASTKHRAMRLKTRSEYESDLEQEDWDPVALLTCSACTQRMTNRESRVRWI